MCKYRNTFSMCGVESWKNSARELRKLNGFGTTEKSYIKLSDVREKYEIIKAQWKVEGSWLDSELIVSPRWSTSSLLKVLLPDSYSTMIGLMRNTLQL